MSRFHECCGRAALTDHTSTCLTRRRPDAIAALVARYKPNPSYFAQWLAGAIRCALRAKTRTQREQRVLTLELRPGGPQVVSECTNPDFAWGFIR